MYNYFCRCTCACVYMYLAHESFFIPVYVCIPVYMEVFIGKCAQSVCQCAFMCCLSCVYFVHLWVFMDRPICLCTSVNVYVCVALHLYMLESLCSCIRVPLAGMFGSVFTGQCVPEYTCVQAYVCVCTCVCIYLQASEGMWSFRKRTKRTNDQVCCF